VKDELVTNELIGNITSTFESCQNENVKICETAQAKLPFETKHFGINIEPLTPIAKPIKDGKSCRLKTDSEKLSKIIRKTGKSNRKVVETEGIHQEEIAMDLKEKRNKRKTKLQQSSKKTKSEIICDNCNQQKSNKKSAQFPSAGKTKTCTPGKSSENSNSQKQSKKQKKKTSKSEL
jgi:hypothetical protein